MDAPNSATRPSTPLDVIFGGGSSEPQQQRRFEPFKIVAILQRNLLIIAIVLGTSMAIGLIASALTTARYTAVARIQIEQQSDRILQDQEDQVVAPSSDTERFLQTQLDIMRSRALTIAVARRLNLFGSPRFYAAMGIDPRGLGQGDTARQRDRESTIGLLRSNLGVDLPRNSRVASISFNSTDPDFSAVVANAFANEFITSNLQRKFDSSAYAREFLSRQLVETKAKLEDSERALNAYSRDAGLTPTRISSENGESATTSGGSITTASLGQLNSALNDARIARVAAEQQWRSASSTPTLSLREVIASPTIQALVVQRAQLTAELNEARSRYREDYPLVVERTRQVSDLTKQIDTLASRIKDSIRRQYEIAKAQEQALRDQLGGARQETLGEQDRSVRFNILAREVDTNRTLYNGLLQRFKEVSASSGISTNNISIVDVAERPFLPASPRPMFNLAIALLTGIALATAVVLLREQMDDAVRSPEDVERKLGLKTFGVVPLIKSGEDITDQVGEPRSPLFEAFSAIRNSLLYSTSSGLPKSLVITSAQAAEGKSITSYSLARSLARIGKRVVLVDSDMRRPSAHRFFNMDHSVGLSDLLVSSIEIDQALRQTQIENLWVITSGPIPPAPSDLLGNARITEIIEALEARFDVVVIDAPPVLGLADAPALASQAMATLFVTEANRNARGRTKNAIKRLRSGHAEILGVILNKFEPRRAGAYEYYGYEYYAYGEGPTSKSSRPD